MTDKLNTSVYRGFYRTLVEHYGYTYADAVWSLANKNLRAFQKNYADIDGDAKLMILPAAAIYTAMQTFNIPDSLEMLVDYGEKTGKKLATIIHGVTSVPFVPQLLWKNMPVLMRATSSEKKGYKRRIVSETNSLVAVDILECPLYNGAIKIGLPQICRVVCAMDKAYMCGFKNIQYTRTTSVALGDSCCDYRLCFDKDKL